MQGRPSHEKSQEKPQEKQEKGPAIETKAAGEIKTQTPRKKQLQSRAERTEKVQTSEDKTKETTPKLKGKTPPATQTKTVKTLSTGSQKTVDTGLSTGSLETEQQREKSPEILAREAVAVLDALSTSPKEKGKQNREPSMYFKARRSMWIKAGRP